MALSAQLVWEVRTTGNSANGGAFRGTALAGTPAAPTVTPSATGGTVAAGTYYCVLTYTPGGETRESPVSGETAVTLTGTTSSFVVTHPTDPGNGATWNLYAGTTTGGPYFPQGTALAIGSNRSVTATPPATGTQPPGVDYSQQDSPQVTYTDLVIGATNTTATSAASPFTPAHVGNLLNVTGGTGFTVQRCEITGVTAAGVATFDKALGTASSTGGAGRLAGAVDHPATIGGAAAANNGNIAFVKYSATPYSVTSSSSNVSGGILVCSQLVNWVGYDVTRTVNNTDANRPIVRAGINSVTTWQMNTGNCYVRNVVFDNPSNFTATTGLNMTSGCVAENCKVDGHRATGINLGNSCAAVDCEIVNCGATGFALLIQNFSFGLRVLVRGCTSNSTGAVALSGNCNSLIDSVVTGTTGNATSINVAGQTATVIRCVVHGGSGGTSAHGFSGQGQHHLCVAYGNSGDGFRGVSSAAKAGRFNRCFSGGNSGSNYNASFIAADQMNGCGTLSGDPFTNAAALDFSTNKVAGAGALIRGLAVALPGGTTTSYPDAGAAQHADAGAAVHPPVQSNTWSFIG